MKALIEELTSQYFTQKVDHIEAVPFGLTNLTQIITVNDKKYVARIYDPLTKSLERLRFEIDLIAFLESVDLSFKVPEFVKSLTGERYVELPNGRLGVVVHFIEGEMPDLSRLSTIKEYGKAAGEISRAFKNFHNDQEVPDIHFHNISSLHTLCNETNVKQFFERPPFELDHHQMQNLFLVYENVQKNKSFIERLPMQIIHHDLLIFNLLMDNSKGYINGILDFDFASNDVRALELAICMNHLLQFDDSTFMKLELFLSEYSKSMLLTEVEIIWIPFLMQMYYVSLLCIYVGQYLSCRDTSDYFRFILNQLNIRKQWLEKNEKKLIEILSLSLR